MVIEISLSRALEFSKKQSYMFVEIVDEKPCNVSIFYLSIAHNFNHHIKKKAIIIDSNFPILWLEITYKIILYV